MDLVHLVCSNLHCSRVQSVSIEEQSVYMLNCLVSGLFTFSVYIITIFDSSFHHKFLYTFSFCTFAHYNILYDNHETSKHRGCVNLIKSTFKQCYGTDAGNFCWSRLKEAGSGQFSVCVCVLFKPVKIE